MQLLSDDDKATFGAAGAAISAGCDVLDDGGNVIDTLDDSLLGGSVTHTAYANVHRLCELRIARELDWSNVWLQPWQSVTAHGHTVTRPLGVFRPTMPELPMGAEPLVWTVSGADRISLMQDNMRDTKTSVAGSLVQSEIVSTVTDASVPGNVIVDSTLRDVTLTQDMTWVLDVHSPDSFLRRVNDLQAAIGGRALFMDSNGDFQVQPYILPELRAEDFIFDLTNTATDIVAMERTSTTSGWTPTNWWMFVRENMSTRPVEGAGIYTVDLSDGGRIVGNPQSVSTADQASLVAQGDQIVATERGLIQIVEIQLTGFVGMEHFDVFGYKDPQINGGAHNHCQARHWDTDLKTGVAHVTLEIPRG